MELSKQEIETIAYLLREVQKSTFQGGSLAPEEQKLLDKLEDSGF